MIVAVGFKGRDKISLIRLKNKNEVENMDINKIDFILIVSKNIPTNDEIKHSKIIDIFVLDLNHTFHKLHKKVQKYLLNLEDESEERFLANTVPILESNVILCFIDKSNPPK